MLMAWDFIVDIIIIPVDDFDAMFNEYSWGWRIQIIYILLLFYIIVTYSFYQLSTLFKLFMFELIYKNIIVYYWKSLWTILSVTTTSRTPLLIVYYPILWW